MKSVRNTYCINKVHKGQRYTHLRDNTKYVTVGFHKEVFYTN